MLMLTLYANICMAMQINRSNIIKIVSSHGNCVKCNFKYLAARANCMTSVENAQQAYKDL